MRCRSSLPIAAATGLLLSLSLGGASPAEAASYGDYTGNTVEFLDVRDDNGLFGAPNVSGDSLDFSPNTFEAQCPGGSCPPSPLLVDSTLTLQIQADPGSFIDTIVLSEAGDTLLTSVGGAFAFTSVVANVFVDIFEIDGQSVNNISTNASMVFTNDGSFETDVEGPGSYVWTGLLSIDLDQIIADAGATGRATLIELNLDNSLIAYADSGASARIEKKDIDGLAITVIPEPGTALLLGLGLVGLAAHGRRS